MAWLSFFKDVREDAGTATKDISSRYATIVIVFWRINESSLIFDLLGHKLGRGRRHHLVTACATETHGCASTVHLGQRIIVALRIFFLLLLELDLFRLLTIQLLYFDYIH